MTAALFSKHSNHLAQFPGYPRIRWFEQMIDENDPVMLVGKAKMPVNVLKGLPPLGKSPSTLERECMTE